MASGALRVCIAALLHCRHCRCCRPRRPQNTRRELADEVVVSRQQWLDESRRARGLEKELDSVRMVLISMGVETAAGGSAAGEGGGTASKGATSKGDAGGGAPSKGDASGGEASGSTAGGGTPGG